MVPSMATLFYFLGNRRKTLFFLFYSFCLFFLLSFKKRKKRIRNKKKIGKRKTEKKRTEKEYLFSIVNKSHFGFFLTPPFCFFDNPTPPFFFLIQATPFCVYGNPTRPKPNPYKNRIKVKKYKKKSLTNVKNKKKARMGFEPLPIIYLKSHA